jgi:hypothetical protein
MKSVESLYKDAMRNAVLSCSKEYGFDSAEALMRLGVDSVTISVKGTKEKKAGVKKAAMPSIALPFTTCNPALCSGLKQNHGLYTQCSSAPVESNSFCKGCIKQCEKNESGKPDNGTIEDRVKSDFKGPKGDAPKHYTAVMKKLKLTTQQVLDEAAKFGIEIDEEHFIAPATQTKRGRPSKKSSDDGSASVESKKRGRPKKAPKDVKSEGEVDDLFANLVSNAEAEEEAASETSSISGSETSTKSKKTKLTDAEKAEKKQALEQEKAEKKLMAEQEKETKKLALEQAKADKKAAAEKEKADKKAALEAEKAEKKAAADQLKAEKEAKKAEAEKEKAEKKAALEAKKVEKESKPKAAKSSKKEAAPAPAPAVLKVKKFEFKGTKYLKSSNGVVYNMEQDEVGTWNEESKEIDFKAVDDEEEEEEYESDDE